MGVAWLSTVHLANKVVIAIQTEAMLSARLNELCHRIASGQDSYQAEQQILATIESAGGLQVLLTFMMKDQLAAETRFVLVEVLRSHYVRDCTTEGPQLHNGQQANMGQQTSQNQYQLLNQRLIVDLLLQHLMSNGNLLPGLLVGTC